MKNLLMVANLQLEARIIKLKTTHEFVESQAAKAVVGQTIY